MSGFSHMNLLADDGYDEATASLLRARRVAAASRLQSFFVANGSMIAPSPTDLQLAVLNRAQYNRRTAMQLAQDEQLTQHALNVMLNQQAMPETENVDPRNIIPIGFFQDPRGNSWAASLQHPSVAPNLKSPDPTRAKNEEDKVITLCSDDDYRESPSVASFRASPQNARVSLPQPPKKRKDASKNALENKPKSPGPISKKSKLSAPKSSKINEMTNANIKPSKAALVPTENAHRNSRAPSGNSAPSPTPADIPGGPSRTTKALAGLFTQKLLSAQQSDADKQNDASYFVNRILLTTTGWTKETAPARIPFPPQHLTIDMEQIEELAQDMVDDRFVAVRDAIHASYSEMKSRHDEILTDMQRQVKEELSNQQSIQKMAKKHKSHIRELENYHTGKLMDVTAKLEKAEKEIARLKVVLVDDRKNQQRALAAYMKATVLSFRTLKNI